MSFVYLIRLLLLRGISPAFIGCITKPMRRRWHVCDMLAYNHKTARVILSASVTGSTPSLRLQQSSATGEKVLMVFPEFLLVGSALPLRPVMTMSSCATEEVLSVASP